MPGDLASASAIQLSQAHRVGGSAGGLAPEHGIIPKPPAPTGVYLQTMMGDLISLSLSPPIITYFSFGSDPVERLQISKMHHIHYLVGTM